MQRLASVSDVLPLHVLDNRGQGSVGAVESVGHMLISVDGLRNSQDHMISRHHPPSYCLYLVIHSAAGHSNTNGRH